MFVCLRVTQNQSRRTRHCRGRAWTARRPDCPFTLEGDWSASCSRKTATRCFPLVSTPSDSASSTWTTLKCLPHHQTHTHLSGKTRNLLLHVEPVWRSCDWQCYKSLQSQTEFVSGLLWRWERGADIRPAYKEDPYTEEKDPQVRGEVWRGAEIQGRYSCNNRYQIKNLTHKP